MRPFARGSIISAVALGVLLLPFAIADTSSSEILQGFALTPEEIERLEQGEILAYSDEEYEFTERELSADALIRVHADMDAIMQALQDDPTLIPSDVALDHAIIESEADFDGVAFGPEDVKEVKKLFKASPDKTFNFSADEYVNLRRMLQPHASGSSAERLKAASDAMRAILIGRYNEYRAKGLAGVAPYQRSERSEVDVGAELQLTTDAIKPFEGDFPEFVRVMTGYPEGADCCEHVYRWIKVKLVKRRAFALSHTIIQTTDEFVLVTERIFYISSQANSAQITTAWLPYPEGGHLGLAVSASADILDSTIGRLLRPIGRNKAKKIVTEVMEETRADLEKLAAD